MGMNREKPRPGTRRLEMVASLVPPGSRVADVGTDHGLLPRLLLSSGRAAHCIATDFARGPRQRHEEFAGRGEFGRKLEFRTGFGLRVLNRDDQLDVVVLSGLGARSIAGILEDRPPARLGSVRLVLQPQSEPALVRRWLFDRTFSITAEKLTIDRGRFYVAIAAEAGPGPFGPEHPLLDRAEIEEAGPCLVRSSDPLVRAFWRRVLRHQEKIIRSAADGRGRETAELRRTIARRVLNALGGEAAQRPR